MGERPSWSLLTMVSFLLIASLYVNFMQEGAKQDLRAQVEEKEGVIGEHIRTQGVLERQLNDAWKETEYCETVAKETRGDYIDCMVGSQKRAEGCYEEYDTATCDALFGTGDTLSASDGRSRADLYEEGGDASQKESSGGNNGKRTRTSTIH